MKTDLNELYHAVMSQTEVFDTINGICRFYELAKASAAEPEDWQALETQIWAQLISYTPVMKEDKISYFDFSRLGSEDWCYILTEEMEMINHPAFDPEKMNAADWLQVLFFYPCHIQFCPEHILMDAIHSGSITPESFGREIEWAIDNTLVIGSMSENFGKWLLDNRIMLTEKDFKKTAALPYDILPTRRLWVPLIIRRPEFLQFSWCPYHTFTPEDWQEIAENCPADFRQYVPQDLFTQELDRALKKNV